MFILNILLYWAVWGETDGIINGRDVRPEAFPWLAALLTQDEWKPRCSGTIISVSYVLTASACLIHKAANGSWVLIDPKKFVIVIPVERPLETEKNVHTIKLHPNASKSQMYYAGIVGVKPVFEFNKGIISSHPIWIEESGLLRQEMQYVLDNIDTFSCYIVAWQDVSNKHEGTSPIYKINSISVLEVKPHYTEECKKLFCNDSNELCEEFLNGTLCLSIMSPSNGQFCGSDRGAGLSCGNFLWGVLIGGASCTNEDPMPIVLRMDAIAEFVVEHLELDTFGISHSVDAKPFGSTVIQIVLRSMIATALFQFVK